MTTLVRAPRASTGDAGTTLYRNGLALVASSGLSSLLGSLYWVVASHRASAATIGQATALVAALVALASVSQLSLGGMLAAYLPRTGRGARALVLKTYALAGLLGVSTGTVFALVAPVLFPAFRPLSGATQVLFPLAVAVWALFGLQDNALTGLRRSVWVPVENVVYSLVKLLALVGLGASVTVQGLFATWVVPAAAALLPVSAALFWRFLPRHRALNLDTHDISGLRHLLTRDSAGMALSQLSTTLLPVLVVVRLGNEQGGAFAIAWLLTQSLDLVAVNLGMSLTVEGSHDEKRLRVLLRTLRQRVLLLVGALAIAGALAAPLVLRVFGAHYEQAATPVLRLLLAGTCCRAVTILALCAARARRDGARILRIQACLAALVPAGAWLGGGHLGLAGVGGAWALAQAVIAIGVLRTEPAAADLPASGRPRILLVNHWHDDNKGDSAITAGLLTLLRQQHPGAALRVATLHEQHTASYLDQLRHVGVLHDISAEPSLVPTELGSARPGDSPSRTAARWLVRLLPWFGGVLLGCPHRHARARLRDVDLVVVVGGSNIYDNPDVLAPLSLARLFTVLYPAWAAGRAGVPVVLAGHTLGPFARRSAQLLARRMLRRTDRAVLREWTSCAAAEALGLSPVCVQPDMAFATEPRRTSRVSDLVDRLPFAAAGAVVLAVRQHPHAGPTADAALRAELARFASIFHGRGGATGFVVVAQCHGPTAIEDDRPVSRALVEALDDLPVVYVEADLAPDELAALYGSCGLVVAVRLHAAILALAAATPAFAISYLTRKTEGVMTDVGLPHAWCAFDRVDAGQLVARAEALMTSQTRGALGVRRDAWLSDLADEVDRWLPARPGHSDDVAPAADPLPGGLLEGGGHAPRP